MSTTNPLVVLITGANSGVGLATVQALLSSTNITYHVILTARSLAKAQAAASELETSAHDAASRISPIYLDVTDYASILTARDFVEKQFGHLDGLINNAAISGIGLDVQQKYKTVMETNVVGPAVLADVFRPLMLKSAKPYSIFVGSGAGSFGRAIERFEGRRESAPEPKGGGAYHVSKAALNMLALREHHAFAEQGIKVFVVSPGFVVSNLRGTGEEERSGWGRAQPASGAGCLMLSVLQGHRDGDVGRMIRENGVDEW